MIYLDNVATTKVSCEVLNSMLQYFSDIYGNPGSIHTAGLAAAKSVEKARAKVALPIGARPEDIIFTSGGSEANTMAIAGLADHLRSSGKTHIITTQVEHHSVLNAVKYLSKHGCSMTLLPVENDGSLSMEQLANAIQDNTGLVSVMAVNNETGNKNDIYKIGEICRDNDTLFHTDCVQAYCSINIDVDLANIDFLSASGHKIHAPKGIGFLYARHKELLTPVIFGGSQEFGLRGGTENVPYIAGIGYAAEVAHEEWLRNIYQYGMMIGKFKCWVRSGNLKGIHINGDPHDNSKTINLRFDGVDGETLLMLLDSRGIVVSAGSACSAHYAEPSHVLKALGLTDDEARNSIRISVSKYTTSEEIDEAIKIIADSVRLLRGD